MTDGGFREIDDAARAAFAADGVICLRGAIGADWRGLIAEAIAADRAGTPRFYRDQTPEGSPARYEFAYWSWPENPAMRRVVFDSPAADLATALLQAERLHLLMDNWFLREGGATKGAPWHHDAPYFDFDGGRSCAVWIPLEDTSTEEGLSFIAGSHRDCPLLQPMDFKRDTAFEGVGADYAPIPDFDAPAYDARRRGWDMAAGDCLIFDLRTVHAASAGRRPLDRTIRRLSLRFGDGAVRFRPRGPWTAETAAFLMDQGQAPDAPLDCPALPIVRPRGAEAAVA